MFVRFSYLSQIILTLRPLYYIYSNICKIYGVISPFVLVFVRLTQTYISLTCGAFSWLLTDTGGLSPLWEVLALDRWVWVV